MISGQLIKTKTNIPFISHYGIVIVIGSHVKVLHNTPGRGSVIDDIDYFLEERILVSVEDTDLVGKTNQSIINRFHNVCKRDYRLFSYNCEHFIDCMLNQNKRSEQLFKFGLIGVGLFLGARFIKKISQSTD